MSGIFDSYDFCTQITNKAMEIYESISAKEKRSKNRKRYIFYAIYNAHRELGFVMDQYEVAKKVGLEYKEISKAKSISPDRGKTFSLDNNIRISTMIQCLPSYYSEFFLDNDNYHELEIIIRKIADLHPYYNTFQPHKHVAIICSIHAEYLGCIVNKTQLSSMLLMDYQSFMKTYKLLSEIYYST